MDGSNPPVSRVDCRMYRIGPSHPERQGGVRADITYGTNNEFGFDYLRDNMSTSLGAIIQRGHNYAIVDEADSILIDEYRTLSSFPVRQTFP